MSSPFPETSRPTRRSCLRWAAATAATAGGLAPFSRGDPCPCQLQIDGAKPEGDADEKPLSDLGTLRVCADPNNLPFSNRAREGFEDKIAQIVAKELGRDLEYEWLPQRLGFFRNALKTLDAHLVMAAPAGFDKAMITDPYYRSTYVFVTRRGDDKAAVKSFDDPALRGLKIGIQLTGGSTPPAHALARRKLIDNVRGFAAFDETTGKPAERIVAAVATGEVDVSIVWGAQAGYFAKRQSVPLDVTPVSPERDGEGDGGMPFAFSICMAVRRSDAALRDQINAVIARRRDEIDRVLDEYGVPRLEIPKVVAKQHDD